MIDLPRRTVEINSKQYHIHGLVHDTSSFSLSNEFKSEVIRRLEGKDIICEDGFSYWIPNSKSFNEIEYFGLNKVNFRQIISYWFNRLVSKPLQKSDLIQYAEEMKTIDDLIELRKVLFRSYLATSEKSTKRYEYEAAESIKYAIKKDLRELHIIVGCAHEMPLEYFLKKSKDLNIT